MSTRIKKRKIELVPYVEIDGIRTLRDSDVMALYERMAKDGTTDVVFFDGSITSAEDFLRAMKYGPSLLYVVLLDDVEAGIVYLNRFDQKTAHFNWCLFGDFWGMPEKTDVAVRIRDILFEQRDASGAYLYDAFLGLMLPNNFRALSLAKSAGVTVVGEIPNGIWNHKKGRSETGILVCYPREDDGGGR